MTNSLPVNPEDIITSDQLPEPAKVFMVSPEGSGIRIRAVGVQTNQFYDRLFQPGEFTVQRITFGADGERFRLAVLAERIRAAAQFDPHFAIGASQIDPLPHQIDAVYNYLLRSPRIRFLLADDPGAGKTIMAGLLFKELQNRGVVDRVLVVTPANLTMQWQDELQGRFSESFAVLRGGDFRMYPGGEVWRQHPRAVVSVDLLKRPDFRASVEGVRWDLVIVDEAHKMAAFQYGEKVEKTQAYQLGEDLSERTDHLLLMTATPHRGNQDNFRLLLRLLDRELFERETDLYDLLRQQSMPIFLRRLKEHMVDFDGKPLFPPRAVDTVRYKLAGKELELYTAVTEYVSERFQRAEMIADDRTRRNVALALMVLQRRLASSLRAIRRSLERREEKLRQQLADLQRNPSAVKAPALATLRMPIPFSGEEPDDDEERWEQEDQSLGVVVNARTAGAFKEEIAEVHRLYELATAAEEEARHNAEAERKLAELRRVLERPLDDEQNIWQSGEKLVVFTENRDTLDYLAERFRAWGFKVAEIYGGMDQDTRRQQQAFFKEGDGAQILVATEAAGEGINLQFCRLMVNYDIPWNPNRLEQRMGRIHRYGQQFSVRIFNLVAENTREGEVLDRVLEKLEQMRKDLGSENVYDIIGDLLSAADLQQLVQRAVRTRQSLDDLRAVISDTVEQNEQRRKLQAALMESLAADVMSADALDDIREQVRTADEQRLVPEYIEQFVVRAFRQLNKDKGYRSEITRRRNDPDVWHIETVPIYIRSAARQGYSIKPSYPQIVFAKKLQDEKYPHAEFIAPGHPFFEALLVLVEGNYGSALSEGACFHTIGTGASMGPGLFWLWDATVKDGTGATAGQKLVGVHQMLDGTMTEIDPLALLDVDPVLDEMDSGEAVVPSAIQSLAAQSSVAEDWCKQHVVDPYLEELRRERQREANVRESYLQHSLGVAIDSQEARIMEYAASYRVHAKDGQSYDIGIRTLEATLEEYKTRLQNRMDLSAKLRAVGANAPRLRGVCALLAGSALIVDEGEPEDPDIERIAVERAMQYELAQEREPQSVETKNVGYDLRSRGANEIRYIEVKGRTGTGAIKLTLNEWIKAARFREEYWLYVVFDCETSHPRLLVIQDPARNLPAIDATQVVAHVRVNAGDIQKHATSV